MIRQTLLWSGLICAGVLPACLSAQEVKKDWLDIASGAVTMSVTSQYDAGSNSATAAISGDRRFTWYTKENVSVPQTVVYELAQVVAISEYSIDTRSEPNSRAPKAGALWGSAESPEGPWTKIGSFQVDPDKGLNTFLVFGAKTPARWLKFEFETNWGSSQYLAVTEFAAYGEQIGQAEFDQTLANNYASNYENMRLKVTGNDVVGCYDWQYGTLSGDTDGRLFRFQWTEIPAQTGTATLALSANGERFGGLFYENGKVQGIWTGKKLADGVEPGCQLKENAVADALSETNRAVVYGIHFDFDSDKLRPEAAPALELLKAALDENASWTVEIQGHTDSDGSDAYNLNLSSRRAASVVAWLVDNGTEASRLISMGYGEAQPINSNDTADGRALNRRVEVQRR